MHAGLLKDFATSHDRFLNSHYLLTWTCYKQPGKEKMGIDHDCIGFKG